MIKEPYASGHVRNRYQNVRKESDSRPRWHRATSPAALARGRIRPKTIREMPSSSLAPRRNMQFYRRHSRPVERSAGAALRTNHSANRSSIGRELYVLVAIVKKQLGPLQNFADSQRNSFRNQKKRARFWRVFPTSATSCQTQSPVCH
jgi:hypothetical protein